MKLFKQGKAAEEDIYRRLSFDPQSNTLLDEIDVARREIDDAFNNFQNASDPDLIDSYIYKGNAAWLRYRFLLRQAVPFFSEGDALHQKCHIHRQRPHDLQTLRVLRGLVRVISMNAVPILAGRHRHSADGKIFIQFIKGR